MAVAIVLAAGMATRMGQLKQILPLGGRPALSWIVDVLVARCEDVVVVLGHAAEEVEAALAGSPVQVAYNENYRRGMLTSVQCGVEAAERQADYLICLGDQPHLAGEVVDEILRRGETATAGMVIPTYGGKRGHPILIRNKYRDEIGSLDPNRGLNVLMRKHPEDILEVEVVQREILDDMDTPEDYRRELDRWRR